MKQPPWSIMALPSPDGTAGRSKIAAAGFNRLHQDTHNCLMFASVDHAAGRVPVSGLY